MPTTVFGLPTHILIIHLAVVGIPASRLATIAVAARDKWRQKYALGAAILAVVMTAVTYAAQLAGERLYNAAPYLDEIAAQHRKLGEDMVYFMGAVAVFTVLLALLGRMGYSERHWLRVVISALAIASALVCLVWVVRVGDSGARAAWGGIHLS